MEGQSEVVGGEQNNQTVQPLVADENDQNVKSKADGKKKAKSPGTDKKCREKKKRKTEDTEKQLEETRSQNDELEKVIAFLIGKLDQAEKDRERQNATQMNHDEMKNSLADLLMGKVLDRAQKYGLTIGGYMERQQVVEQSALTDGGLTHGGDLINNISPPRAAMASGSSLMQEGLLALGGQPVAGRTGFGIPRPFDFYHPATGSTLELGSPNIQELLCPSHEVERAHPGLTYGGLTYDGDLNYTSLLGAAMASGSLPMHGSLAPGGQLSFEVTGFGTAETGLPVHHPSVHQFGTTMGSGGLAVEDSPGLPQSELSQVWTHLPMPDTSFLDNDWIEDQYNAPTRMS